MLNEPDIIHHLPSIWIYLEHRSPNNLDSLFSTYTGSRLAVTPHFGNSGLVVGNQRRSGLVCRIFAMQDHELYMAILGIQSPWPIEPLSCGWNLAQCIFALHTLMAGSGLTPNTAHLADGTISRRSGAGPILTPASTARFFTPSRHAASALNLE